MAIVKKIAQALFNQYKYSGKNMAPKTPVIAPRKSARRPAPVHRRRKKRVALIDNEAQLKQHNAVKSAINIASKFTSKTAPALRSIKLSMENGTLGIQATDIESWFSCTIHHAGTGNEQVCVDAKKAAAASRISELSGIRISDTGVFINGELIPASCAGRDIPSIPFRDSTGTKRDYTYNIPDLGHKLSFIKKAINKSSPYNNNIFFDIKQGSLVATDGMRIHTAPTGQAWHDPEYTGGDILIHEHIAKVSKPLSGKFQIVQGRHAIFELELPGCETEAGYRLLDGQYPGYEKVIPQEFSGTYTADKREILKAIKQVIVNRIGTDHEAFQAVRIYLSGKEIRLDTPYKPYFKTTLQKGVYEGDDVARGVNPIFLHDAIHNMPDKKVCISLTKSNNEALVIRGQVSGYAAAIMPLRIDV